MRVVGPKSGYEGSVDLFLGGGISNCPDWQAEAIDILSTQFNNGYTVSNPRRSEGLERTGDEAARQIAWEHKNISRAEAIMFWFPEETLCPITLFELGVELGKLNRKIYVGTHPNYQRRFDLIEQIKLVEKSVKNDKSLNNEQKKVKLGRIPSVVHSDLSDVLKEFAGNRYSHLRSIV